jgi:hypothetical protein
MTIPLTLDFSSIVCSDRERSEHLGIEELAESIFDSGLILPIVLKRCDDGSFSVLEGGRRWHALQLLLSEGRWDGVLHYGETSEPGKPGYVIKKSESSYIVDKIIEIKGNLDRHDFDWRDSLRAIVKAWRLAKAEADANSADILMRDFGSILGCGYADLQIGNRIYDHFVAMPQEYEGITSINGALSVFLKCTANEVSRIAVAKSMSAGPVLSKEKLPGMLVPDVTAESRPQRPTNILLPGESAVVAEVLEDQHIPLSQSFLLGNSLDWMESNPGAFCDHIICDPDYAIDVGVLDSNQNNRVGLMQQGVRQDSVEASLRDLYRLIPLAYKSLKDHGFFIFWYSIDHHEKLQAICRATGFAVQGWPLIWNKMDFRGRSNAAPNHNFPKSVEFAMVCRKPGTVLRRVQTSCVYTTTGNAVTKELNHPFAKPYDIWRWIFSACCEQGQIVYDPFIGSGSMAISAITYGLRPIGHELDPDIYNSLLINLQNHYRKLLGPNVRFS